MGPPKITFNLPTSTLSLRGRDNILSLVSLILKPEFYLLYHMISKVQWPAINVKYFREKKWLVIGIWHLELTFPIWLGKKKKGNSIYCGQPRPTSQVIHQAAVPTRSSEWMPSPVSLYTLITVLNLVMKGRWLENQGPALPLSSYHVGQITFSSLTFLLCTINDSQSCRASLRKYVENPKHRAWHVSIAR